MISKPYLRITEEVLNRTYPNVHTLSDVVHNVSFTESTGDYDVFISHSYKNKESIARLHQLFSNMGFEAFVDWMDPDFDDRSKMNEERAGKLREYLSKCHCLVYVDSIDAEKSAWCPWELGLADAYTAGRCFILPPLDGESANCGHQYLQLYDTLYLSKEKGFCTRKGSLRDLLRGARRSHLVELDFSTD